MGPQGLAGQAGAQGIPGVNGATGVQGPGGATGSAGPAGLSFRGAYDSQTNYTIADGVLWQGAGYVSLLANNHGNTPSESPAAWTLFAASGAVGATGPMGPPGSPGSTGAAGIGFPGATGPAGVTGAQGVPGLAFQGAYSSVNSYSLGDAVSYNGSSYVSLVSSNHGNTPDQSPASWSILAAQGLVGAAGVAGPAGGTGAVGPAGAVGPTGPNGATGSQGPAGTAGLNFRGVWVANLTYTLQDGVTFGGSTYLALAVNSNAEPDTDPQTWSLLAQAGAPGAAGSPGAMGNPGLAATVAVGPVTVLPAGSQPTVTNTGTSSAAVLAFGLPAGGSSGPSTAPTGSGNFAAMYHPVSYSTIYYALNTPNAAPGETAAVMAWVPRACTATRLDVYSQQSGQIKVTLRSGTPGSMADTALVCDFAGLPAASCTAAGSVAVAAGSFLDFRIDNASGTPAGVWTALDCN